MTQTRRAANVAPWASDATNTFSIVLKNDVRECVRLRKAIDNFTETNKFPEKERFELQLCLQEAVMNIIKHGLNDIDEHDIDIQMLFQRNRRVLTIRIADDGKTFNSLGENFLTNLDLDIQCRWLDAAGFVSVRKYADHLSYFRHGRYNHLMFSRNISREPDIAATEFSA